MERKVLQEWRQSLAKPVVGDGEELMFTQVLADALAGVRSVEGVAELADRLMLEASDIAHPAVDGLMINAGVAMQSVRWANDPRASDADTIGDGSPFCPVPLTRADVQSAHANTAYWQVTQHNTVAVLTHRDGLCEQSLLRVLHVRAARADVAKWQAHVCLKHVEWLVHGSELLINVDDTAALRAELGRECPSAWRLCVAPVGAARLDVLRRLLRVRVAALATGAKDVAAVVTELLCMYTSGWAEARWDCAAVDIDSIDVTRHFFELLSDRAAPPRTKGEVDCRLALARFSVDREWTAMLPPPHWCVNCERLCRLRADDDDLSSTLLRSWVYEFEAHKVTSLRSEIALAPPLRDGRRCGIAVTLALVIVRGDLLQCADDYATVSHVAHCLARAQRMSAALKSLPREHLDVDDEKACAAMFRTVLLVAERVGAFDAGFDVKGHRLRDALVDALVDDALRLLRAPHAPLTFEEEIKLFDLVLLHVGDGSRAAAYVWEICAARASSPEWTLKTVPTRLIEQLARVSKVSMSYPHYVTTGDRAFRWCATRPLTERETPATAFRTHVAEVGDGLCEVRRRLRRMARSAEMQQLARMFDEIRARNHVASADDVNHAWLAAIAVYVAALHHVVAACGLVHEVGDVVVEPPRSQLWGDVGVVEDDAPPLNGKQLKKARNRARRARRVEEAAASAAAPVAAAAVEDEDEEDAEEAEDDDGPRLELCLESTWSQLARPRAAATRTARSATCEERDDYDRSAAALVARLAVDVPDVDAPPDGVHVVKTLIKDEQVTEAPEAAAVPAPNEQADGDDGDDGSGLECGICLASTSARCVLSCGCAKACSECGAGALSTISVCPFCRVEGVSVVVRKIFV